MSLQFSRLTSLIFSVVAATAVIAGAGTVATIATGSVPAAYAQDQADGGQPGSGPRHGRMGKILMGLNLTDAQKTQIRAIMRDARKQNKDVTDRDTRRATMKAAYAKVETVLTPAQRTELHAKLEAMHAQHSDTHAQ